MLEQDYLMRILLQFAEAIRRSWTRAVEDRDPRVTEYIARSLLLASGYLREAGDDALADVRADQARALAEAYDLELPDTPEELALLLDEADAELARDAESTMDVLGYGTEPVIPAAVIETPLDSLDNLDSARDER